MHFNAITIANQSFHKFYGDVINNRRQTDGNKHKTKYIALSATFAERAK